MLPRRPPCCCQSLAAAAPRRRCTHPRHRPVQTAHLRAICETPAKPIKRLGFRTGWIKARWRTQHGRQCSGRADACTPPCRGEEQAACVNCRAGSSVAHSAAARSQSICVGTARQSGEGGGGGAVARRAHPTRCRAHTLVRHLCPAREGGWWHASRLRLAGAAATRDVLLRRGRVDNRTVEPARAGGRVERAPRARRESSARVCARRGASGGCAGAGYRCLR